MSQERMRILNMLAEGKISAEETEKLLSAIESSGKVDHSEPESTIDESTEKKKPKNICILIEPKNSSGERVNIKIPLQIIRAGVKLKSILPDKASEKLNSKLRDKGIDIDLNKMDSESIEGFIKSLCDFSIDVDDKDETVKIFCN